MEAYNIVGSINYSKRLISVSALYSGTSNTSLRWELRSPEGEFFNGGTLYPMENYIGSTTYYGSGIFSNYLSNAGINDSAAATNKLFFSDPATNWNSSSPLSTITSYLTGTHPIFLSPSKNDGAYVGAPLLVTRGDTVLHATVSYTSGQNFIRISNTTAPTLASHNFVGYVGQVLSGANSGQYFNVTSAIAAQTGLYLDVVSSSYSGQLIKLMPRCEIIGYSGWDTYTGDGTLGTKGIKSEFTITPSIKRGLGSPTFTFSTATFSGNSTLDIGPAMLGIPGIVANTQVILLNRSQYEYEPLFGDTFSYLDTFVANNTATVVRAGIHDATRYFIEIFPRGGQYLDEGVLYRANRFRVENVPKFDTDYHLYLHNYAGLLGHSTLHTPAAKIDITANEFDSTFSNVGELAHFHLGPITLSNGEVLMEQSGTEPPFFRISGAAYNGDVTSPTTLFSVTGHSTYANALGGNFNGRYFRNGVLTVGASISFNTSETIAVEVAGGMGSAMVKNVVYLPVQPSV